MGLEESFKDPKKKIQELESRKFIDSGFNSTTPEFDSENEEALERVCNLIANDKSVKLFLRQEGDEKSARVVDKNGKDIFFTKWPKEVATLVNVRQRT